MGLTGIQNHADSHTPKLLGLQGLVHALRRKSLLLPQAAEALLQTLTQLAAAGAAASAAHVAARRLGVIVAVASLAASGGRHLDALGVEETLALLHLLGVALDGVGRFTLALKIVRVILLLTVSILSPSQTGLSGKTHLPFPTLVGATGSVRLPHKVRALVVIHPLPTKVISSVGNGSRSLEGHVLLQRILDVLSWCGPQRLHVAVADGSEGAVLLHQVPRGERGVIRAVMVVRAANGIKPVDGIRLGHFGAVTAVRGAVAGVPVGRLLLATDDVEGSVGHVARESLGEGRVALVTGGFLGRGCSGTGAVCGAGGVDGVVGGWPRAGGV